MIESAIAWGWINLRRSRFKDLLNALVNRRDPLTAANAHRY